MRAVIQRVSQASVEVEGKKVGEIQEGLLILLGIESLDSDEESAWLAGKTLRLRIFRDEHGSMNRSVQDIGGEILVISQFTLLAETKKGNRPSFISAAAPEIARRMYDEFCVHLERGLGRPVQKGLFGADMKVSLTNDGPVTICLDTKNR